MEDAATAAAMIAGSTIIAVVQGIKDAGLPSRFARLVALIVGALLGAAAGALTDLDGAAVARGAAAGFVAGVASAASYAAVKSRSN